MRTSSFIRLFTIAAIACVAVTLMGAKNAKNVGIVNMLIGAAERYPDGSNEGIPLEIGSKIYILDRIVTDTDTKIQLVFRDDSVVTIGEMSELVVSQDSYNFLLRKRETTLSLLKGKVRSVVGDSYSQGGSKFEVHTRTAIAGVRGTENLVIDIPEPPSTEIYGIENTTYVQSPGNTDSAVAITGNQGARVNENEDPETFDYDPNDPEFQEILGDTSIPGGDDIENDIRMNSFDGQDDPTPEDDKDTFDTDEQETGEEPTFDQETDPDPDDSEEYMGYQQP